MGFINVFIVFIEGILSIFSPCILPLLPVYLSMLSNSSVTDMDNSNYQRRVLLRNTMLFTLGIATTFFILGSSISVLSTFIDTNKSIIMIIGGIIILFMGFFYLDIIKIELLNREKKLNYEYKTMSKLSAFLLGFTFSFGWTPCIGPILASVLVMASSADNFFTSNLLILVYTLGFILPFIIVAFFYSKIFKKFIALKKHMKLIKRISGIIILLAGLMMIVNGVIDINKELSVKNETQSTTYKKDEPKDFTLIDQYGNSHTLSEYKGKTVFLNFWATWCPPCREEMPYINELYKEYGENKEDVIILGIAAPKVGREGSKQEIINFLNNNKYEFPVVMDESGEFLNKYAISAFPTTFIISSDGEIVKKVPGSMNKATMKKVIEGAKE
ncbi:MAG: redoxin family protein [Clostridiales bacterium]|nr:redoxin family protein [Clostridiales bacterium]